MMERDMSFHSIVMNSMLLVESTVEWSCAIGLSIALQKTTGYLTFLPSWTLSGDAEDHWVRPAPRLQEFRDLADLFLVDHFLKNLPSKKRRGIVGSKDRFWWLLLGVYVYIYIYTYSLSYWNFESGLRYPSFQEINTGYVWIPSSWITIISSA